MLKRYTIIQELLRKRSNPTYLEIGLALGENWFRIRSSRKIGVDPRSVFTSPRLPWYYRAAFQVSRATGSQFFVETSDDFFAQRAPTVFAHEKIDVAFIDGLHTYEQSFRDVQNCLRYLKSDGVIVLHDCNPPTAAATAPTPAEALRLSGNRGGWNGDVWKTIVRVRSEHRDLVVSVLDCDEGLGIIRYGTPTSTLAYTPDAIATLTYQALDANRRTLLNLQEVSAQKLSQLIASS